MNTTDTVRKDLPPPPPTTRDEPRREVHNRGAQAAPHVAVGCLVVAASAAQIAVNATGNEKAVLTWTMATAFVVAVVVATQARRRVFDGRALKRVYCFLVAASGWLAVVALDGLSLGKIGVLMAITYGLALHWWRVYPFSAAEAELVEADPDEALRYGLRWAEEIGAQDGCLPGTQLVDPEVIPSGIRYTLRLRPGRQTLGMVQSREDLIRGGLGLRYGVNELVIERHPRLPEPHVRLTVVTRSPVRNGVLWEGPSAFDASTGRVLLGPHIDGEGGAKWRVYSDNRLWGGYVQGGTGAGKSRLIDALAMSIAASESHPTVVLYADGQEGASSPMLMRHADYFAGTYERIRNMAKGMYQVMRYRQRENIQLGLEGFNPSEGRPGLLGVLDECHMVLMATDNPEYWAETQFYLDKIARAGGKVGVALVLASQDPTYNAFGGAGTKHCATLRASLLTGNGVMLAGEDDYAMQVFGVKFSPKNLPQGGGYGYLAKPAPGERQAQFRSSFLNDKLRDMWPARITWRELPAGTAAVFDGYPGRERTVADRQAVVLGEPVDAPVGERSSGESFDSEEQVLESFGAKPFPSVDGLLAAMAPALPASHQDVLDAIEAGARKSKEIAEAVGRKKTRVHEILKELEAQGRIRHVGEKFGGHYMPARLAA